MKHNFFVKGEKVGLYLNGTKEYLSLTDIARYVNRSSPADSIKNWLRRKDTISFLGLWEKIHNPTFKLVDFNQFKNSAGTNAFVLSPTKWIRSTNAIGLITKAGKYGGGTYAHKDIAFEFASWISSEFKLYLIMEFQRLKKEEYLEKNVSWSVAREIAKINYSLQTKAIKEKILPPKVTPSVLSDVFASEAEIVNKAVFGMTSTEWKKKAGVLNGTLRDHASILQLIVVSNIEVLNSEFISQGFDSRQRVVLLNEIARKHITLLTTNPSLRTLKKL